jgi:hypothetical protein
VRSVRGAMCLDEGHHQFDRRSRCACSPVFLFTHSQVSEWRMIVLVERSLRIVNIVSIDEALHHGLSACGVPSASSVGVDALNSSPHLRASLRPRWHSGTRFMSDVVGRADALPEQHLVEAAGLARASVCLMSAPIAG